MNMSMNMSIALFILEIVRILRRCEKKPP